MTASKSSLLSLRAMLLLMAVLTGLTWLVGTQIERYTAQTPEIPQDFPGDIGQWQLYENWKPVDTLPGLSLMPNGIKITRESKGISTAELRVPLPETIPAGAKLLASAELSTEAISGGVEVWHGLLYTIWFYDDAGNRIKKTARTVQALKGDAIPLHYAREIALPPHAVEAGIGLRVFESTGTATMVAPKIQVVAPWAGYSKVILAVLVTWAVFGLLVLVALASHGRLLYAVFPMAMVAIIAVGVSLPNDLLMRLVNPLERALSGVMPDLRALGLYSFNKVGHAATFALLALFACIVRKRIGATWIGILCFLILLAVLSEGMQLFFVGRSTRISDMGIDLSGAAFGVLVFFVLWLISSPFRRPKGATA